MNKKFLFTLLILGAFFKPVHAINAEQVANVISSAFSAPCYYMALKFGINALYNNTVSNATKGILLLGGGLTINYLVAACATRSLASEKTKLCFYQGALGGGILGGGTGTYVMVMETWQE